MEIKVLASGSKGNAYFISDGETPLLLEAGIPWRRLQQALNFHTSGISACLITHEHGDHSRAVRDVMKAGIDCCMSRGTYNALNLEGHRAIICGRPKLAHEKYGQIAYGNWIIAPFVIQHDAAEPIGFLLYCTKTKEKLAYITDSYYSRYIFSGLTHIMLEVNYDQQTLSENVAAGVVAPELRNRLLKSHMSLETAVQFLKANDLSQVQAIHIIHVSDGNANEERIRTTIQRATGKPVYIH